MQKIIVVCGPTATGKSDYAVKLAKQYGGEIISADSRQVYKGLNIGSGKITTKEMKGVPHYLLDVTHPLRVFSVSQYKSKAQKAITNIAKRGKIPIVCGGSGYYIDALVYNQDFPKVKPDRELRRSLEKAPLEILREKLQQLDPDRYEAIDQHNRVRLIRAIEIAKTLGSVPKQRRIQAYEVEWVYLDFPDDILKERIHVRLYTRMKQGMVQEVQSLHDQGLSWKRLYALGLEYRYVSQYLQGLSSKEEMLKLLEQAIWQYAKRQRTWFKKYAR
jgi:tRNA dimethylallyltransferase